MKTETRQRWLILLTAAVLVLFAADRFGFGPLSALWKKRAGQIAGLRSEIERGKALLLRERHLDHQRVGPRGAAQPGHRLVVDGSQQLLLGVGAMQRLGAWKARLEQP